jgi:DNA-binding MarR family transcriptional regulator
MTNERPGATPEVPEDASPVPSTQAVPSVEEVVTAFMATMNKLASHFFERSAEFDLSPQLAKAFQALREPLSMGELAEHLYCDASNVTGIVDRLEGRGLVERKPDPNDRRVKRLVLTPQGETLWQAHHDRVFDEAAADMPCFPALSGDDRRTLLDLLHRMLG